MFVASDFRNCDRPNQKKNGFGVAVFLIIVITPLGSRGMSNYLTNWFLILCTVDIEEPVSFAVFLME